MNTIIKNVINSVDAEIIRSRRFKVVVDTGCGAGSLTLPFLLRELGCQVLTLGAQPDGTFPWRNPEPTPEALTELSKLVKMTGADMGAAHDGDADRIVFMDENGEFINEEVLLAMMAKYMLEHEKGPIVTPVSSSQRMADVAKDAGVELYWTAVGSINVARKMMEVNAVFGGEGNGGLIFPKHQYCRDGAMACAKILEILAGGKKLSELAKSVPEYFNAKTKVPSEDTQATMERVKLEASELGLKIDTTRRDQNLVRRRLGSYPPLWHGTDFQDLCGGKKAGKSRGTYAGRREYGYSSRKGLNPQMNLTSGYQTEWITNSRAQQVVKLNT